MCKFISLSVKKTVKVVQPYIHPGYLNFKLAPYEAWVENGGKTLKACYPCRLLHGFAYRYELPSLWQNKCNAVLMFVEPVSITFDTFPYYITHEIIPFIWDCWPMFYEKMFRWFITHEIKTAIFSSSQTTEVFKKRFPDLNVIWCPEAIENSLYDKGKDLAQRSIDLLEFGRSTNMKKIIENISIKYVATKNNGKFLFTDEELRKFLSDSKISITYPRSITQPDVAAGVETLTQRYWECMFSRTIMIGHAPQELIDLIGYNPVIEIRYNDINSQKKVIEILNNIEDYQELVNKNFNTALKLGGISKRMDFLQDQLKNLGYNL